MRDQGFTLLEIMVAAAILAFGIAAVLSVFGDGLRSNRWSAERTHAMLEARSLMDEVLRRETFEEEEDSGQSENGKYLWSLSISPVEAEKKNPFRLPPVTEGQEVDPFDFRGAPDLERYRIRVRIEWPVDEPKGRVELSTMQLQKAETRGGF